MGLLKEVEYIVVNYAALKPRVTLSLRQADILMALAEDERLCKEGDYVPDLQKASNTK
jgi:glutamate--cysteine ligase catalytic subunit